MPKPRANESLAAYTKRFMRSTEAESDFPDRKQRYAVMRSMFKKKKRRK
ncbi:MAG: hypothetical protein KGL39_43115 [Patescibacteria group bacterium]|nr:hypothetical protein [Patescibacteria group bacterium]